MIPPYTGGWNVNRVLNDVSNDVLNRSLFSSEDSRWLKETIECIPREEGLCLCKAKCTCQILGEARDRAHGRIPLLPRWGTQEIAKYMEPYKRMRNGEAGRGNPNEYRTDLRHRAQGRDEEEAHHIQRNRTQQLKTPQGARCYI